MNNKKSVLVVGAGLGGLSTAIRLAKKGYQVEILEKNAKAGGRLNQLKKDGFTFDIGPSFFSMSYEFEEFARDCGIKLPFEYVELDPLYSVNFSDNPKTFHLYKDIAKLAEQFKDIEPDFEEKMHKYLKKSGALFNDTIDLVVRNNFDSMFDYITTLMRVNPVHVPVLFKSFYQHVEQYFDSKEAQQIVSLVAFFLGRTPFDTMAIYTLLSYTEFQHDGYYNVKGGMYKVIEGFVDELVKDNIKIHYNTEIVDYTAKGKKIESVVDKSGKEWTADTILINADAAVFRHSVMKHKNYTKEKMDKKSWTMGFLTFYIGLKCKLPEVNHHNYYLGSNYKEYADNVLSDSNTLEKPYYYVNVVSKYNEDCAPEGCENLFFVCPVPNLINKDNWDNKDEIVDSIIDDFSKRIGKDIAPEIISRTIYTPIEWGEMYNLYRGSGLGLSHTFTQIGAMRPANVDEKFNNLFYVGASTVPGAGLPMAMISSKLAFERIEKYFEKTLK